MGLNIGNVSLTNTFDYWRQRTNDAISAINSALVSLNSNTSTGNAVVNGTIQAVTLVGNTIGGSGTVGATGLIGAAANLTFSTNTVAGTGTTSYVNDVVSPSGTLRLGTGTANLVANSTHIKIANSTSNVAITVPSAVQVAGGNYFLNANGSWLVVATEGGVGGADTTVLFNDLGAENGVVGFTFNKTTTVLTVANTFNAGNSTVNATMRATGLQINGTQVCNTTNFIGTANNATFLNGVAAANYVNTAQLTSNLANYTNTFNLAATYTSQAQLSSNLANYLTTASASSTYLTQTNAGTTYLTIATASTTYQTQSGMSAYLTTSSASSTYTSQAQLSANLANYTTTSSLSANLANYTTTSSLNSSLNLKANSASPTFTGNTHINGPYRLKIQALGTTSSVALNCADANFFTATMSGATTVSFTNVPSSVAFSVTLKLSTDGSSVTWPGTVRWPNGTAPTLSTTGKIDYFTFVTDDGGTTWHGAQVRKDSR